MSEDSNDRSFVVGRYYADGHEETSTERRTRRALKLLDLVERLVPPGIAVAVRDNEAIFRAERDGRAYETIVTSGPGTHVLDCAMTAVSLYAAADVCHRFVSGERAGETHMGEP